MKIKWLLKNVFCFTSCIFFFSQISFAQNTFPVTGSAGIGTLSPDFSSALDITSTTQGLLVPRMTQTDRDAISSPTVGLLVFQTNNTPGFYYYDGISWIAISINAANKQLSNLTGPSAVNIILQPGADKTIDLGSTDFSWKDFYMDGALYIGGSRVLSTSAGTGIGNTVLGAGALTNNTTGYSNTASGFMALYSNISGERNTASGYLALYSNTTGIKNTATGYQALYSNTTGKKNTATGYNALSSNTTGNHNTANGYRALNNTTTGNDNTANGYRALNSNSIGSFNTAAGYHSLYKNTTGDGNSAYGYRSLNSNVISNANTAIGYLVLYRNTGEGNTAIGYNALASNTTGSFNTALGNGTDISSGNLTNTTALGYSAIATASNSIMLGNTSVTSVKAAGNIVIVSDGRFKKNIKANVPGLDFINALKPITYNYDIHKLNAYIKPVNQNYTEEGKLQTDDNKINEAAIAIKEKIIYTGFVAQDVDKAAAKLGYEFSGVYKPQNDKDPYGLSYAEFVVPLVKAVQELSKMNADKDDKIDIQQKQIDELKLMMAQIQQTLQQCSPCTNSISKTNYAAITEFVSLDQNAPNPFSNTTTIGYSLPQKYSMAQIIITDKNGKAIKTINISGFGKGKLNLDASVLASGTYNYSMSVDGKLIGTKQMILTK